MARMTIGKAAEAAGVNVETIRFYERKGLIVRPPRPSSGGFREYPADTVQRVRFIREAQKLGFSLREAAELASLEGDPGADAGTVCERAQAKLDEVNAKMHALETIRSALQTLIASCPQRGPIDQCAIIAALTEDQHRSTAGPDENTAT